MSQPAPARTARSGDLCVLLLPDPGALAEHPPQLDWLQRAFGGRHVRPLHMTLARCDPQERTAALIASLENIRSALRSVTVTATGSLAPFTSDFRGEKVLKMAIAPSEALSHSQATVLGAVRSAGLESVYGDEHWWTVTVLEGIDRSEGGTEDVKFPLELFVAKRLALSRIDRAHEYTMLYEADFAAK